MNNLTEPLTIQARMQAAAAIALTCEPGSQCPRCAFPLIAPRERLERARCPYCGFYAYDPPKAARYPKALAGRRKGGRRGRSARAALDLRGFQMGLFGNVLEG